MDWQVQQVVAAGTALVRSRTTGQLAVMHVQAVPSLSSAVRRRVRSIARLIRHKAIIPAYDLLLGCLPRPLAHHRDQSGVMLVVPSALPAVPMHQVIRSFRRQQPPARTRVPPGLRRHVLRELLGILEPLHASKQALGCISHMSVLLDPASGAVQLAPSMHLVLAPHTELEYRAPELLLHPGLAATPATDIWALGCLFAHMLLGRPLFRDCQRQTARHAAQQQHLLVMILALLGCGHLAGRRITPRDFDAAQPHALQHHLVSSASPSALDLLARMLHPASGHRISARTALNHPFLARRSSRGSLDETREPRLRQAPKPPQSLVHPGRQAESSELPLHAWSSRSLLPRQPRPVLVRKVRRGRRLGVQDDSTEGAAAGAAATTRLVDLVAGLEAQMRDLSLSMAGGSTAADTSSSLAPEVQDASVVTEPAEQAPASPIPRRRVYVPAPRSLRHLRSCGQKETHDVRQPVSPVADLQPTPAPGSQRHPQAAVSHRTAGGAATIRLVSLRISSSEVLAAPECALGFDVRRGNRGAAVSPAASSSPRLPDRAVTIALARPVQLPSPLTGLVLCVHLNAGGVAVATALVALDILQYLPRLRGWYHLYSPENSVVGQVDVDVVLDDSRIGALLPADQDPSVQDVSSPRLVLASDPVLLAVQDDTTGLQDDVSALRRLRHDLRRFTESHEASGTADTWHLDDVADVARSLPSAPPLVQAEPALHTLLQALASHRDTLSEQLERIENLRPNNTFRQ